MRRLYTDRRVTATESARNAPPPRRSVSCLRRRAASVGGGGGGGDVDEAGAPNQEKGLKDMAVFCVCQYAVPEARGGGVKGIYRFPVFSRVTVALKSCAGPTRRGTTPAD